LKQQNTNPTFILQNVDNFFAYQHPIFKQKLINTSNNYRLNAIKALFFLFILAQKTNLKIVHFDLSTRYQQVYQHN